jgi:hypothetical protein
VPRAIASSVGVIGLILCLVAPGGAQIPPSVRAKGPAPPATEEDRARECADLKQMVEALKKDVVWLRQEYSAREVRDLERVRAALDCPDLKPPLEGQWRIVGVPRYGHIAPMLGTVDLRGISEEQGRQLADEPNWGLASSRSCRGKPDGTFYYSGTIEWDKGSFYDKSRLYWTDKPGTIILCTTAIDSTYAVGNFRDSRQARGGFIQWNGMGEGQIIPESVEGPAQTFTPARHARPK